MKRIFIFLLFTSFGSSLINLAAPCKIKPSELKTEWMINPVGVDVVRPGLSWLLISDERDQIQTAYQVIVSSSEARVAKGNGDIWDSGKITSGDQINIIYNGPDLHSNTRYLWKVRVWDRNNNPSGWSQFSSWEMGLLKPSDWHGKWISTTSDKISPLFRKEFIVEKPVKRATAFVIGLGWYELHLNGSKIGDQVLAPANSDYSRRIIYDSYDVTKFVVKGANTAGLWLAGGYGPTYSKYGWRWMDSKRALLQLHIEFTDGSTAMIVTDETWKATGSNILAADMYNGETFDATQEKSGWDRNAFNDKNWENAIPATAPKGKLISNMSSPVRVTRILKPVSVKMVSPGCYVFDIGQNISGWVRLNVKGAQPNTRITLRHAEVLKNDGNLDTHTNRKAEAKDIYICKGSTMETWEPRFTYHGFRYVELTGYPGTPDLSTIEACAVHADVGQTGMFECSDSLVNRIHSNFRWTMLNNMVSIPTDNPVRDERTPCQMDENCLYEAAIQNFDVQQYFKNWLTDIYGSTNNPDWAAGQVLGPWLLFQYYGDKRILETFYPSAKREVDYCTANASRLKNWSQNFGDWCPPFTNGTYEQSYSEGEIVNTTLYYYMADLLAKIAGLTGRSADSVRYSSLADSVRTAFNSRLYNPQAGKYGSGKQITYIMPLLTGIVPGNDRFRVFDNLLRNVTWECNGHFGSGIYGTSFLPDILCDNGKPDVALTLFTQTTYPGFGYQIKNYDATTTWEQWDIIKSGREMETYNHAMFSGADKTFFTRFAGIRPLVPGYRKILIKPMAPAGLQFVNSTIKTVMGVITSDWKKAGKTFSLHLVIPVNTTALVFLPGKDPANVTENGHVVSNEAGIKFLRQEDDFLVFEVGSGSYNFSIN